jgi:hypothetical protein
VRLVADQRGGEIDQELVDMAFTHQRAVQLPTGFDVDLVHPTACELSEQRVEIDLARFVRHRDDFGACGAQRVRARPIVYRRGDERSGAEHACARRGLEAAVDDDSHRLSRRFDLAHRELRIVVFNRAYARQHRARTRAPAMAVGARLRSGDPLAAPVRECGLAVEARRDFHAHPRPPARHA